MNDVSNAEKQIRARLATEEIVATAPIVAIEFEYIANHLEVARRRLCPYPTNGSSCDCKYGVEYGVNVRSGEKTGCPELRELIAIYRAAARGYPNRGLGIDGYQVQ